jgi:hypothetical protein
LFRHPTGIRTGGAYVMKLLLPFLSGVIICSSLTRLLAQTAFANEQISRKNQIATLQAYVEKYIDNSLATAPWAWNHPSE